jgi:hypothetical protein
VRTSLDSFPSKPRSPWLQGFLSAVVHVDCSDDVNNVVAKFESVLNMAPSSPPLRVICNAITPQP